MAYNSLRSSFYLAAEELSEQVDAAKAAESKIVGVPKAAFAFCFCGACSRKPACPAFLRGVLEGLGGS